ncbi:MAG: hypothetical protein ACTSU7_00630 [Candidatus Heimdallarchaeaceae archaeon]
MVTIGQWIVENWQLLTAMGVLFVILSMTGTITQSVRSAKKGLKESITPLGFVILLTIGYIAYQIYLSLMETL